MSEGTPKSAPLAAPWPRHYARVYPGPTICNCVLNSVSFFIFPTGLENNGST